MKNFISLFIFSLLIINVVGQELKKEVILDINGVEASVELDVSNKIPKIALNETYFWYKPDRIVQTVGGFQGQLLNGYYIESYPNGQLKLKGSFCKGQQCKVWKYWSEEGKLERVENWKQNQLNGEVLYMNVKGEIQQKKEYKKGKEIKK